MILRRLPAEASPWDRRSADDGEGENLAEREPAHGEGSVLGLGAAPRRSSHWIAKLRASVRGGSLRARLTVLITLMVLITIVVITVTAYQTVSQVLYTELDKNLQTRAQSAIDRAERPFPDDFDARGRYTPRFHEVSSNVRIMIVPPTHTGQYTPVRKFESVLRSKQLSVLRGEEPFNFDSTDRERMFAVHTADGRVIVVAQDLAFTKQTLDALELVLVLVGVSGALGAIILSIAIVNAGLQPISRLRRAADRVTETGELRKIPVYGQDEVSSLTHSFNDMMSALEDAQTKQRNLVADASHELKTPLTSMRTNIELLMQASKNKNAMISEADRADIERDVIAQIEEMSSLIGDLVELARDEAHEVPLHDVDIVEILQGCIGRVQRRCPDVTFDFQSTPWSIEGDSFALSRALLNVLDNGAKWSPSEGTVRIVMTPCEDQMELRVSDSGPGIPEEERNRVFDRFYRSIASRSMPGSGLGLSIVKQTVERHGGSIRVAESDDGGTMMVVRLPGGPRSTGDGGVGEKGHDSDRQVER